MKLHSTLVVLFLAAVPLARSAPPGLSTGQLGGSPKGSGSLTGSGPATSGAGTMTKLPGAAVSRGLSFDAHSTASGGAMSGSHNAAPIVQNNGNPNGGGECSTTRTRKSRSGLEITVRNTSSQADSARIEWFFVAEDEGSSNFHVWDSGQRDVSVPGVGQAREVVSSTEITSSVTRTTTVTNVGNANTPIARSATTQTKSGTRPYGWIVRMFVDGQFARVQASTGTLEQLGRNSDQLNGLVRKK